MAALRHRITFSDAHETGELDHYVEQERGTSATAHYINLSTMAQHQRFSQEELRLNDYAHGRGLVSPVWKPGYTSRGFWSLDGLLTALVPSTFGSRHASCRTPAFLAMDFGSESVTLRVGSEGESTDFLIHRDVLTRRSPMIREALKGKWKEAETGIVPMTEDEPEVVALYQKWLYTGCIFSDSPQSSPQEGAKEYEKLVKCYVLGEKLLDGTFKDCVIDAIISLLVSTHRFDPTLTDLVYESTPPSSPLRKLWQDIYIFCGSSSWLDESQDPHPDFAIDLSRRQMGFWQGVRPQDGASLLSKPCAYHEHDGGKCYRVSSAPVLREGGRDVVSALWS